MNRWASLLLVAVPMGIGLSMDRPPEPPIESEEVSEPVSYDKPPVGSVTPPAPVLPVSSDTPPEKPVPKPPVPSTGLTWSDRVRVIAEKVDARDAMLDRLTALLGAP